MLLGRALSAQGLTEEARGPLVSSVTIADEIGSPLLRWRARAALAEASPAEAAARLREAGDIINAVVAGLTPPRAAAYLAAPEVVRVGELAASA
jgi:hypothetical protein